MKMWSNHPHDIVGDLAPHICELGSSLKQLVDTIRIYVKSSHKRHIIVRLRLECAPYFIYTTSITASPLPPQVRARLPPPPGTAIGSAMLGAFFGLKRVFSSECASSFSCFGW